MRKSYKGTYYPKNPKKYLGDPTNIIFRSLAERKFMTYLDSSDDVLEWASEEFSIPYLFPVDNRMHRYFPDFFAKVKTKNGLKKFVIEIKPKTQTAPPRKKGKYFIEESVTYIKNKAKWEAAEKFCSEHNAEFIILAI